MRVIHIIGVALLCLCQVVPSTGLFINVVSWNDTSNSTLPTTNLTSYYLASAYSTIGIHPNVATTAPIILLYSNNLNHDECTLKYAVNVTDRVVVLYDSLPPLKACNRGKYGSGAALAKILQSYDALALVIPAMDGYEDGRVVGFSPGIQIPVVVVAKSIIQYLAINLDLIVNMELPPIESSELALLNRLSSGYTAWIIINAVLYGALMILMGLALYAEIQRLYRKKKYYSHRGAMVLCSLASAVSSFLWLVVDPFGGRARLWWYTSSVFYLYQGMFCIVNLLIVRMWILFTFRKQRIINRYVSAATYFLSIIALFFSIMQGCLWYDSSFSQVFMIVEAVVFAMCGVGYVLFGKNFLVIFSKGGNASPDGKNLPAKIALFILIYVIVTYTTTVISFVPPMGGLFGNLFVSMVVALLFYAIFLFLFFPKLGSLRKKPIVRKITFQMSEIRISKE